MRIGQELPCVLSRSQRNCGAEFMAQPPCESCGWNKEECNRRKGLPLERDENGLRRKYIGKEETENGEDHGGVCNGAG